MILIGRARGEGRTGQSALRHKVRNLRAKVRLLLPNQACGKYSKRSKNLLKMLHNKSVQQLHRQRRWCHCHEGSQELYIPHDSSRSQKHLFHKLTKAQIEQIKEDKLYYVGEQFIEQFDQFLEAAETANRQKQVKLMPNLSIPELSNKISNFHKTISSNYSQPICTSVKENEGERLVKKAMRFQDIIQKRKIITEEEQTRRKFIRAKLQEREERRLHNYEKALATKEESIKHWNHVNEVRTSQSIRTKLKTKQIGEISEFSEKLRNLCLQRCVQFRG